MSRRLRDHTLRELVDHSYHPDQIIRSKYGRPSLPEEPNLDWSSSSCIGGAAIAWCRGTKVGMDIERLEPELVSEELRRCTLTADELKEIDAMIGRDPDLYFDLWTRKEAVLKLLGTGLHLRPDHARVGLPETEWKRAIVGRSDQCWVRSLKVRAGMRGAVACVEQLEVVVEELESAEWAA